MKTFYPVFFATNVLRRVLLKLNVFSSTLKLWLSLSQQAKVRLCKHEEIAFKVKGEIDAASMLHCNARKWAIMQTIRPCRFRFISRRLIHSRCCLQPDSVVKVEALLNARFFTLERGDRLFFIDELCQSRNCRYISSQHWLLQFSIQGAYGNCLLGTLL